MSTLAEIESAVKALPLPQQEELFQQLAERLNGRAGTKRRLSLVPATGRPITKRRLTMPSTPTEAVLDVNIIIAAIFADHVRHASVRRFVEGLVRFLTTPMTQGGGALQPGRHVRYDETPMTSLYLAMLERMGVSPERVGESTGKLENIQAE